MRFLANESFPGDAVAELRASGHDVTWVREDAPGMRDPDILSWAMRETRVLLTFDKEFGELAWRAGLPATCGLVLFRLQMPRPDSAGTPLAQRIAERSDWEGHFSVIEPGQTRVRKLPQ